MKKSKFIISSIIFLILVFVYFSFFPIISPDSSLYYSYLNILNGTISFSQWEVVRGPSMPLVLKAIVTIFGDNVYGFLIGTFIFYVVMLYFAYQFMKLANKEYNGAFTNFLTRFLFIFLIVFNPLVIGYFHAMLTEFVATSIAMLCCYLSYKWIDLDYRKNIALFVIYSVTFCILSIFMWFLKQPYVVTVTFPLLLGTFLSSIKKFNIRNVVSKVGVLFLSIIVIFPSIKVWDYILNSNNVESSSNTTGGYLTRGLVSAVSNFREKVDYDKNDIKYIENLSFLNERDKDNIEQIIKGKSKYKEFRIYDVYNLSNTNIVDRFVLYMVDKNKISFSEMTNYLKDALVEHPILLADSYVSNYLATIDVYTSSTTDYAHYYPLKTLKDGWNENKSLGLVIYEVRPIYWWGFYGVDRKDTNMPQYEKINNPNTVALSFMKLTISLNLTMFKILFFIAPFCFICFLFKYIRRIVKKIDDKFMHLYEMLIILFGYSFLHVLFHAFTGAIIDRYASVAYPTVILASVLVIKLFVKKNDKKLEVIGMKQEYKKGIFVIPAYNEEMSIGKVIDEIRKDMPGTDIVVINDCSKDNTAKIVMEKDAKCITMPFNVKYAMAVQTGIKYAYYNDYDYVIQFDADGQHIAIEAKKLLDEMKKSKCDIVIGSRFLKKTDYKHSLFRRMGTKMFSLMVLWFCKEHITDPTSGLQCLNRSVIKRYSQMGKYPEYPDANLIIEMIMDGYKIHEVGVKMRQREFGESMHGGIIKPIKYMIKIFYTIVMILIRNIKIGRRDK